MSSITINNLPLKFRPFLLGSPSCSANIKPEIDAIFQKDLKPLEKAFSSYIFDGGNYVIKDMTQGPRYLITDAFGEEPSTSIDTHLYRVKKAEKIRTYIQKNNLGDHLVVPKKYIYWHEQKEQFYIIAEKINLSESNYGVDTLRQQLTPIQAKTLTQLSANGYIDLSYNKFKLTQDGKVALINTQPLKRFAEKAETSRSLSFLLSFIDRTALLTRLSIAGIAKLKTGIVNPNVLKEVKNVERNHVLCTLIQLIGNLFLASMVFYFTNMIKTHIPITALRRIVEIGIKVPAILKITFLVIDIFSVCGLWHLSCKKDGEGIGAIFEIERTGLL
ncbi:MAG: hypothetical protein ACOVOR_02960 [Rhabdochlamydiaceae bacterium]